MNKQPDPAIERYLLRRMSSDEQKSFEQRVGADPDLALELAFYQALWLNRDEDMRSRWTAKGRALLQGQSLSEPSAGSFSFWTRSYRWAVAASLAVLLTAAGYWYLSMQQDAYENLYTTQFEPLKDAQLLSPSAEAPVEQTWKQAFAQYSAQQYDLALGTLEQLKTEPSYRQQAYLLAGFCFLEQNQPEAAVREFQQVERQALSLYNKAQFYIALAYIRAHDKPSAQAQLKRVAEDGSNSFREKARLLQQELGRMPE